MHTLIKFQNNSLAAFQENKKTFRKGILLSGIAAAIVFAGPAAANYDTGVLAEETFSLRSLTTDLSADALTRPVSQQLVVARGGQSFIPLGICTKKQELQGKCKR